MLAVIFSSVLFILIDTIYSCLQYLGMHIAPINLNDFFFLISSIKKFPFFFPFKELMRVLISLSLGFRIFDAGEVVGHLLF